MTDNTITVHTGPMFFLFLLFLGLKLAGVIAWSWWWVTAPLWGPLAIALVFFLLAFIVGALFG